MDDELVTEGVEKAVERARAAAGHRGVEVVGRPNLIPRLLQAGLVDELRIQRDARGPRQWAAVVGTSIPIGLRLEKLSIQAVGARTSLAFRVERD